VAHPPRHGLITPQPHKRPRSSFVRFEAALPNELWQADTTHWRLTDGSDVEILNLIDDHSRLLLAADAFATVKGGDVVRTFLAAAEAHGAPAGLLTDNGAVFTGGPRRGRIRLETELERLGVVAKHSTPNHPQTCGKVERFHQTLKRYLAKQPPSASLAILQLQLDAFRRYYNAERPHRALRGRSPLAAFSARLKARPTIDRARAHFRVRQDRVSKAGNVTVRYLSRLRHIGLGRGHAGEPVRTARSSESSSSTPAATTSRAYTRPRCRETAVYDVPREDIGAPDRIRTCDLRLRRPTLYPLSYRRADRDDTR
jgi:transposase InsO family protein